MSILALGLGPNPVDVFENPVNRTLVQINPDVKRNIEHEDGVVVVPDPSRLPFDDGSFDLIAAVDVFGDPYLGINSHQGERVNNALHYLSKAGNAFLKQIEHEVERRKAACAKELMRILNANGSLWIVENIYPTVANKFINDYHVPLRLQAGILFGRPTEYPLHKLPTHYVQWLKDNQSAGPEAPVVWNVRRAEVRTQK